MEKFCCKGCHPPLNQAEPQNAPKPIPPAASDVTSRSLRGCLPARTQKDTPFQLRRNWRHQYKSKQNSLLILIGWSRLRKWDNKSIHSRSLLLTNQNCPHNPGLPQDSKSLPKEKRLYTKNLCANLINVISTAHTEMSITNLSGWLKPITMQIS